MGVHLAIEINSDQLGRGRVELECTAIPNDLFIPLAITKLGQDNDKMTELFMKILTSMEGDDGASEDEAE
jgi:hypothetical protein